MTFVTCRHTGVTAASLAIMGREPLRILALDGLLDVLVVQADQITEHFEVAPLVAEKGATCLPLLGGCRGPQVHHRLVQNRYDEGRLGALSQGMVGITSRHRCSPRLQRSIESVTR